MVESLSPQNHSIEDSNLFESQSNLKDNEIVSIVIPAKIHNTPQAINNSLKRLGPTSQIYQSMNATKPKLYMKLAKSKIELESNSSADLVLYKIITLRHKTTGRIKTKFQYLGPLKYSFESNDMFDFQFTKEENFTALLKEATLQSKNEYDAEMNNQEFNIHPK